MADVVQYRLEQMVPELEDLERKNLFSRAEIAKIVNERRKFEYRLKRPKLLKQDFLAYIDFEKNLDALRVLRKKKLRSLEVVDDKEKDKVIRKRGKGTKKSLSDFAGVRRIVDIYAMATMRFKGDVELWFQYLEFCRERKNGRMKKAMAQAIRYHPNLPGLWIYAAAWEFDQNLNVVAARALMQSGLRACPSSEDLWVEYLRMELTYLNKLKARKVELGEDVGTLLRDGKGAQQKQWKDEHKEEFMTLDEPSQNEDTELNKINDLFKEQGYNIVRTVYIGAVEALPTSLSMRKRILEIVEATDLAYSTEMRDEIISDMKRDFSKDPEYWDWLARQEIRGLDTYEVPRAHHINKAVQVYEEALNFVPAASMFVLYVKFLLHFVNLEGGETQENKSSIVEDCISYLERVFDKAESMQCLTEDLAHLHILFYLQNGRLEDAKQLVEKYTDGTFAAAIQLWILRLSIEMKYVTKNTSRYEDSKSSIFKLVTKVLDKAPVSDAEHLWLMVLKLFIHDKSYFDKLLEISVTSLARDGGSDCGFSLSSTLVSSVLQRDGIHQARALYKRYIDLPRPGLALYKLCIELEMSLACSGDKDSLQRARRIFESALATYEKDVNLWRDYYTMEMMGGTSETASLVYWRAHKLIGDAVAFAAPSSR